MRRPRRRSGKEDDPATSSIVMVVGAMVGTVLLPADPLPGELRDPLPGLKEPLLVSFGRMVDLDPFGLLLPFPMVEGDTVAANAVLPRMLARRSTWIFMFSFFVGCWCLSCESSK